MGYILWAILILVCAFIAVVLIRTLRFKPIAGNAPVLLSEEEHFDKDGAVRALGLPVFLLTDCLIQKPDADVSGLELGDFDRLCQWLGNL